MSERQDQWGMFEMILLLSVIGVLAALLGLNVNINHNDTETLMRTLTAELKAEIIVLHAELEAHDARAIQHNKDTLWWEEDKDESGNEIEASEKR